MPNLDGTGPQGRNKEFGRGLGPCGQENEQSFEETRGVRRGGRCFKKVEYGAEKGRGRGNNQGRRANR